MASPNEQLFLDRFIAYNKERYKDEPSFVTVLDNLTLQNVIFTNYRKEDQPDGSVKHLVDMVSAGSFVADEQRYTPADYVVNGVATLVSPDPIQLEELQLRTIPGVYRLEGTDNGISGSVLVPKGDLNVAKIIQLLKAKSAFDLEDTNITISEDLTKAIIDTHTVVGEVRVVESVAAEGEHLYNGEYLYDGTITY